MMTRRLTLVVMTVLVVIGLASCDLSEMMGRMGQNAAGANPGKINAVTEKINETWDDEKSVATVNGEYSLGGIKLGEIPGLDGSIIVEPVEDFASLARSIGTAASTPQGAKALTKKLSTPLNTEDDAAKIEAVKGTAEVLKEMLSQMADGATTREAMHDYFNTDGEAGNEESDMLKNFFGMAVDGIFDITDGHTEDSKDYHVTQGDLLVMQTMVTLVDSVGSDIFSDTYTENSIIPDVKENFFEDMQTAGTLSGFIDQVNSSLQVIDAVAPSSAFAGMNISTILNTLLENAGNSSEGGNN